MTTEFQRTLAIDKETLWQIVKIFHPDLPDTWETRRSGIMSVKDNKLSAYQKYDWVCIDFKVKDYGTVSIGIQNCNQSKLYGANISKESMRQALSDGTCKFHVWRFCLDKLSVPSEYDGTPEADDLLEERAIELLKARGYRLQPVDEMFDYYYSD